MRCLLVGNYGVGNLGDEALREYFLMSFPDIEWTVISAHPKGNNEVPRLPGGLRSLFTPWHRTIRALQEADAVVFGGGSLFTDVESSYACVLWWFHAAVARFFGRPVLLAFQGMGPYQTKVGEWCARSAVKKSWFLSVRDGESMKRVDAWEKSTKVIQTFDPIFSLFKNIKSEIRSKKVFTLIPRNNSCATLLLEAENLMKMHSNIQDVHILLMQPNHPEEQKTARMLQTKLGNNTTIVPIYTTGDLIAEVSSSVMVVTERFHGALAALAIGTPVKILPQGVGDKLSSLLPYSDGQQSLSELSSLVEKGEQGLRQALMSL